jgi:DNA (cytosine-5)-methyltransferase 1
MKLTAMDFFAGAGGLSEGLIQSGFEVILANEISPTYSRTLASNHPDTEVVTGDIRDLSPIDIRLRMDLAPGELDLIAGGPPCQGFSINAPERSTEDHRNHLFWSYLNFVDEMKPKFVLIENVPGIVSFNSGGTVKDILEALNELGYKSAIRVLCAAHYGVPQTRWRTIFIGVRKDINVSPEELYPKPTHKALARANFANHYDKTKLVLTQEEVEKTAVLSHTSIRDAIGDLPAISNGKGEDVSEYVDHDLSFYQKVLRDDCTKLYNHQCSRLGKVNLDRVVHIPQGGNWTNVPFELLPKGMQRARKTDHTKRYGRLAWDGLGSTILTKCDPHWGAYIHPLQDRVISVREAARIQSFPDHFVFKGRLSEQYEQVGNAVPPMLARSLGDRFAYAIKNMTASAQQNFFAS